EILQEEGSNIKDVDLIPKLIIDTSLDADEITSQFLENFYRFEPFGRENPEPIFLMSDVVISDIRIVGNSGKHIKFSIQKKNRYFNVISFNNAEQLKFLKSGSEADIVFSLRTEEWGGQQFLEFQLLGLKEK
ncbi:MAG TPA: hypothetical protein P5083_02840, partial [Candidatus Paceibacterota bacterium]|nr:hypothetical protein [Candidatus Paceibacterota bacterium]